MTSIRAELARGLGLLAVAGLLAGAGCIPKDPPAGDDDTTDACPEPFEGPLVNTYDEIYNPDGIWRTCEPPAGSLCFDCHLCANDAGDVVVDATHYVCKHCHDENGDPLYEGGGCECGELDCEVDPPLLTCGECHTDGCNGYASAEQMNGLCDFCHVQPEGGPDDPPRTPALVQPPVADRPAGPAGADRGLPR